MRRRGLQVVSPGAAEVGAGAVEHSISTLLGSRECTRAHALGAMLQGGGCERKARRLARAARSFAQHSVP